MPTTVCPACPFGSPRSGQSWADQQGDSIGDIFPDTFHRVILTPFPGAATSARPGCPGPTAGRTRACPCWWGLRGLPGCCYFSSVPQRGTGADGGAWGGAHAGSFQKGPCCWRERGHVATGASCCQHHATRLIRGAPMGSWVRRRGSAWLRLAGTHLPLCKALSTEAVAGRKLSTSLEAILSPCLCLQGLRHLVRSGPGLFAQVDPATPGPGSTTSWRRVSEHPQCTEKHKEAILSV